MKESQLWSVRAPVSNSSILAGQDACILRIRRHRVVTKGDHPRGPVASTHQTSLRRKFSGHPRPSALPARSLLPGEE